MNQYQFETFIKKSSPKLCNYLYRILGNKEDAEDIMQSSYIAFYENYVKIEENKYISYLYKIAHNKALNFKKKHKRNIFIGIDNMERLYTEDTFLSEESQKKNKAISLAFQKLPPKMSLALDLQFYQNMSYKEISVFMNISEKAVDSLLLRAKKKIKKIILRELQKKDVICLQGVEK